MHYVAMCNFPEVAAAIVRFATLPNQQQRNAHEESAPTNEHRAGGKADVKNDRGKTPAMLAEEGQNAHCTTIMKMAQMAHDDANDETRTAFLANLREFDHAIKATTIARDLARSMRAEHRVEHH